MRAAPATSSPRTSWPPPSASPSRSGPGGPPLRRPRGRRRLALHQRHDLGAQGRRAAAPPPRVLHHLERRVLRAASATEAQLICVPPYHIAGVSAILSSLYGGRRIVYLPQFDAAEWVRVATEERITHAMVVPTMLGPHPAGGRGRRRRAARAAPPLLRGRADAARARGTHAAATSRTSTSSTRTG